MVMKRKTRRFFLSNIVSITLTFVLLSAVPAFAGQWLQDRYSSRWFYKDDNGNYLKNGWKYIDGSWYYFDKEGWMLSDTITPDGYYVGASGAWNGNGVSNSYVKNLTSDNTIIMSNIVDRGSYYEADAKIYNNDTLEYLHEKDIDPSSPFRTGKVRLRKDAYCVFYDYYGMYDGTKGEKTIPITNKKFIEGYIVYSLAVDNEGYIRSFKSDNGA